MLLVGLENLQNLGHVGSLAGLRLQAAHYEGCHIGGSVFGSLEGPQEPPAGNLRSADLRSSRGLSQLQTMPVFLFKMPLRESLREL